MEKKLNKKDVKVQRMNDEIRTLKLQLRKMKQKVTKFENAKLITERRPKKIQSIKQKKEECLKLLRQLTEGETYEFLATQINLLGKNKFARKYTTKEKNYFSQSRQL